MESFSLEGGEVLLDKKYFLRQLAENGYNVFYGAKKHFSTYDIVEKTPGRIAFITLSIGVWQIYKPTFSFNKEVSLFLILASIAALTISQYNSEKENYRIIGNRLIQIHNELREIYYKTKSLNNEDIKKESKRMEELMDEFYEKSISKQIFISDWIAHYKLFFQSQYEWLDEQKKFTWKDKIPFSLRITVIGFFLAGILLIVFRGI